MTKPKENMFQLARMILHDQCPPDNTMYLCKMSDHDDCECTLCWDNYLLWAANGYSERYNKPYVSDRNREVIEGHGYDFYPEGFRF